MKIIQRARVNFFVDAFVSKVLGAVFAGARTSVESEQLEAADKLVAAVKKELEPYLQDTAPFFGGSSKLTLAEVCDIFSLCLLLHYHFSHYDVKEGNRLNFNF